MWNTLTSKTLLLLIPSTTRSSGTDLTQQHYFFSCNCSLIEIQQYNFSCLPFLFLFCVCVCVCLSDPFMIFAAGWHLTGGCFTWHLMFRLLCLRYNKWTSIHLFHDWSFGCQTQWICCRLQLLFLIYLLTGFFPNDKKTVTTATLTHWDVPTYVVDLCLCGGFFFCSGYGFLQFQHAILMSFSANEWVHSKDRKQQELRISSLSRGAWLGHHNISSRMWRGKKI